MPLSKFFQRVVAKRDRSSSPSPSERSRGCASPRPSPNPMTSPYPESQDGYFGHSDHSSSSAASSATSSASSASLEDSVSQLRLDELTPVFRPTVRLLACIDAIPETAVAQGVTTDPFWVELDLEDDVSTIGGMIENVLALPRELSIGSCFKVSVPRQAHQQAATFKQTYGQQVDLLTHFESFNLDDPKQVHASLGQGLTAFGRDDPVLATPVSIGDCWPLDKRARGDDTISILVRLGQAELSLPPPMTALAYFSRPQAIPITISSPASPSINQTPTFRNADTPEPPVAIEVPLDCTVTELKRIILKADGRPVGALEKCVIWSVDMSWEEMRSCEAFGGLRDAGMPWPYPPTSNPPVKLADGKSLVSKYLPTMVSNPNLVTFYIHIDRALTGILASQKSTLGHLSAQPSPNFHYPMEFSGPTRAMDAPLRRNSLSLQKHSYSPPGAPALDRMALKPTSRRQRPSTAPVGAASGHLETPGIPAFGARSSKLKREPSRLGRAFPADAPVGLGIVS